SRELVVGTGGAELQAPGKARANSEIRNGSTYGVLALSLDDGAYSWQFVPIKGKTFRDSGTASCHGPRPPAVNAGPDQAVSPGDTVRLSVSFSDPSGAAPWSYTIQWGDATSTSGTT